MSYKPVYYSWFRCEPMSLCQLYLQTESVYNITSLLGEKGICEFRDLNHSMNSFQRKFVAEIRRCIEMERKIAFFEKEIKRDGIDIIKCINKPQAPSIKDIGCLEQRLEKLEHDLLNENKTRLQLKHRLLSLTEYREILKKADQFFQEAQSSETNKTSRMMRRMSVMDPNLMRRFSIQMTQTTDVHIPLDPVVDLITLTGTILASRFISFERMLWRVSRGNILLKRIEIEEKLEDPETGELQHKCLFILVCQGVKLRNTCKMICSGFHTELYTCPEQSSERNRAYAAVLRDIEDIFDIIRRTDEHRKNILAAIASNIQQWKITVLKVKTIYETMNLFSDDVTDKCLIAECWIPTNQLMEARLALQQGQIMSNSSVPSVLTTILTNETPPTYNVTNKFTAGFQNIIDSYGVSTYGEVNPAPYSIITFPFIFAVMFGDIGHGIIMALFALWLITKEQQLKSIRDEIFVMFFVGRYIILLMGLFSIYTGAMYNDIFSKSVNLFGTAFNKNLHQLSCTTINDNKTCESPKMFHLVPHEHLDNDYRYYFGIDPIWQLSLNKVQYLNTYKMKISVVLGVLQMLFGIVLSVFNHWHYQEWISIYVEFLPKILFLLGIFGYLNFMIFYKWFVYTDIRASCAPPILITLINMFMFKMPVETDPCYLKEMFTGQFITQSILIIMALLCIPVMLLVKPFYLAYKNEIKRKNSNQDKNSFEMTNPALNSTSLNVTDNTSGDPSQSQEISPNFSSTCVTPKVENILLKAVTNGAVNGNCMHDEHDDNSKLSFGDTFINQIIHTIEYCLGSVSHTASYLRLWALSLAHAQLSEVLWNMVMKNGFIEFSFNFGYIVSALVMVFFFGFWAILTVAILIIMEGLSAFLHALRLHWVEFMSKFYLGSGHLFQPFAFSTIINQL